MESHAGEEVQVGSVGTQIRAGTEISLSAREDEDEDAVVVAFALADLEEDLEQFAKHRVARRIHLFGAVHRYFHDAVPSFHDQRFQRDPPCHSRWHGFHF